MSHEVNIHSAQTNILRALLFRSQATYTDLQKPTGLESHHFNFHIARLIELGFVEKLAKGQYRLSIKGKEYANRLDTDNNTIERQPKAAVLLAVERTHNGERQFLFQQRLKNPYFGYWGLISGKMRWGETIAQTAARELDEEAGLTATWRECGLYHEHVMQKETGDIIEDKLFFVVHGTNAKGTLVKDFEGGHNEWLTREQAAAKDKTFLSFETELDIIDSPEWRIETLVQYSKDNF